MSINDIILLLHNYNANKQVLLQAKLMLALLGGVFH